MGRAKEITNAERFVEAHNRVAKYLRRVLDCEQELGFMSMVREGARSQPRIRRYKDELLQFAKLRNAIVHEQYGGEVIAEPNPTATERYERIASEFENPPLVSQRYHQDVKRLQRAESVGVALDWVQTLDLSQFPVYDAGEFSGLLTERCIAHWLAYNRSIGLVDLDTPVSEVLLYDETKGENVMFLERDATVFEARDLFVQGPRRDRPLLDAVLITEHGKKDEKPLGIITPWDLIDIEDD